MENFEDILKQFEGVHNEHASLFDLHDELSVYMRDTVSLSMKVKRDLAMCHKTRNRLARWMTQMLADGTQVTAIMIEMMVENIKGQPLETAGCNMHGMMINCREAQGKIAAATKATRTVYINRAFFFSSSVVLTHVGTLPLSFSFSHVPSRPSSDCRLLSSSSIRPSRIWRTRS